jgi:hypothetical protein
MATFLRKDVIEFNVIYISNTFVSVSNYRWVMELNVFLVRCPPFSGNT